MFVAILKRRIMRPRMGRMFYLIVLAINILILRIRYSIYSVTLRRYCSPLANGLANG